MVATAAIGSHGAFPPRRLGFLREAYRKALSATLNLPPDARPAPLLKRRQFGTQYVVRVPSTCYYRSISVAMRTSQ
jgi:hypothetical protein